MHPVFISYARKTSAVAARALHQALQGEAFLDEADIDDGDRFSERIVDALLGSRVVVVFPEPAYFDRLFCRWELQATLELVAAGIGRIENAEERTTHVVVVLPPDEAPSDLDRLPPGLQTMRWRSAGDTAAVAALVRKRLEGNTLTLAQRYTAVGQESAAVRARLLAWSENPEPAPLGGITKFPSPFPATKGDRFIGRSEDLWRIDFALGTIRGTSAAAALTGAIEGTGGVGKTQLALEYVHRFAKRRFPGGVFWVNAESDLEAQHHGILRKLRKGIPDLPAFRQEQRSAYHELAAALDEASEERRMLFVVDNIPEETPPRTLSTWCPALNQVTVLTTSRAKVNTAESAYSIPVGVLAPDAAVQLLMEGVSSAASKADCELVARWVGHLPLALTLLNAVLRLKGTTVERLADKARMDAGPVAELDKEMLAIEGKVPRGALRGATATFKESYERLSTEAQEVARLLARLFPSAIPMEILEALGLSPAAWMSLTAASIVTDDALGWGTGEPQVLVLGTMHRVLADYLRSRSSEPLAEWERLRAAMVGLLRRLHRSPAHWWVLQACIPHARHLLRSRPPPAGPDPSVAELAFAFSNGLGRMGQAFEAVEVTQEALGIYRGLVETRGDAFLPDLSEVLDALSIRLGEVGKRGEGLQAAEEAVAIRRTLAEVWPDEHLPGLASSLNHLSVRLSGLGRREEAYRAVVEAVEIRRALAMAKPEAYLPSLAKTLINLGMCQGALGLREEGLQAIQEAVAAYRRLVAQRADDHLPDLANALSTLSVRMGALGRREEALAAVQEAVEAYRKLAKTPSEVFVSELALSLSSLSFHLGELGRSQMGLDAAKESVALYRGLAEVRPQRFQPDLATALIQMSNRLGEVGRQEDGLRAAEEAVALHRGLVKTWPDAFESPLAGALNALAVRLGAVGRREEELEATEEATRLYRRLAEQWPLVFEGDLARTLNNLAVDLAGQGRLDEAVKTIEEAVEIRRKLAESVPIACLPELAMSLSNLSSQFGALGRNDKSLRAAEEAVQIYRRMAEAIPDAFRPLLASALNNLAICLGAVGRPADGLKAVQEAVQIHQPLAEANGGGYRPDLAMSLTNLSVLLGQEGWLEEGLGAVERAIEVYQDLAELRPLVFRPELERAQRNRALFIEALGR